MSLPVNHWHNYETRSGWVDVAVFVPRADCLKCRRVPPGYLGSLAERIVRRSA